MAPRRVSLITAIILTMGLGSALWIYLAAGPGAPSGYEPEESKQYLREMERYGGKANVLAGELMRWFAGLWHGRRLAVTVACATVVVAGAYWLVAAPLPSDLDAAAPRESKRGG